MNRLLVVSAVAALSLFASRGGADNQVKWTMSVGNPGVMVPLPITLFKDRVVPVKGDRWRCTVDNALRQDGAANTFSTLTVHCSDGETTVITSASCLIGGHTDDNLSVELVEKTTGLTNSLRARCSG